MRIVLASASPRRKELINKINDLEVEIIPSQIEEKTSATNPENYAMELASIKAHDVFDKVGGVVLGADTIVTIDGAILGKPRSEFEADEMLKRLCGRTHQVITGICIVSKEKTVLDAEISYVTFAPYDQESICSYIRSGSPFDKAGGYGIQDEEIKAIVINVQGDLDNIIGLPVKKIDNLLKQFRR